MKYHIESETAHRIRVRLSSRKLTPEQAQILEYAFKGIAGVKKVTVYRATGGCALTFDCDRKEILRRLDSFRFENVEMLATKEAERISREEMRARKLEPELKRKLRLRILAETAADIVMPMPVQIGYHVWQMVTLRDL